MLGASTFGTYTLGAGAITSGPTPPPVVVTTSLLTDDDLAGMRLTVASVLPDVATLMQPSSSSDGMGGHSNEYTEAGEVACRVLPMRAGKNELTAADQLLATDEWLVHLPLDTIITVAWRLVVGERTFEVIAIDDPRSWELDTLLRCKRVF